MFNIPPDFQLRDLICYVYAFFSRAGFDDGDQILPEEEAIAHRAADKLCDAVGVINGEWQTLVINSSHNPYYICFTWLGKTNDDYKKGEIYSYYEMNERDKRKIEKREGEIFEK
ncbi:MAG: hypothetical protein LiPW30_757 [Parcubacteria group bacterium LiPW_30]|nr:MAG: hypothetical protein LiPW30_757 [Parcubacteria group bacterium LiPW_30]